METEHINTKFAFNLPFWVMEDQFTRPSRPDEFLDGNLIEDKLFTHPNVKEVCLNHQCWVEFETTVNASQLPETIEQAHQFVEKTLKVFKRRANP